MTVLDQVRKQDGRLVTTYKTRRETLFESGIKRTDFGVDEFRIEFENGDIRHQTQHKLVYYFREGDIHQTTLQDKLVFVFSKTQQVEKHHTDGTKYIWFKDGTTL